MLWYDRRLIEGGTRLDFDSIRQTTLRPFGLLFMGPGRAGQTRRGAAWASPCAAASRRGENLWRECGGPEPVFDVVRARTEARWDDHLDRVRVDGGTPARRTVMATALYHSLIKPCFGDDESPFWPTSGPFAFDVCTMWDIYKTQIPLLMAIAPNRAADLLESLIRVCEEEGNFPIGYRMARGADRFFRQASALAHTALADAHSLALGGLDWTWALVHMEADLRRLYGEDFFEHGVVHPITHTLDLAYGHHCTAKVARALGDKRLADELETRSRLWVNAFDPLTGLLRDSEFYEGGKWNYSFRLLHDMRARIALAGGDAAFVAMLDAFFGFGAGAVTQPGRRPSPTEMVAGYGLNRFEGLNNEPDMEAPVGLPLRRPPGPHRGDRPRRADLAVRHRRRRPAGQRRLGRAELVVRLGVARAVPARRAEPVPRQRAGVRPLRAAGGRRRVRRRDHRAPRDSRRRGRHRGDPAHPVRPGGAAQRTSTGDQLHPCSRRAQWWRPAPRARPGAVALGALGPAAVPVRRSPGRCDGMRYPQRRLVIVVRADPVICGHSGEARNLAEVALTRGFDDVRLLTWPIATLQAAGLPLKPLDRLQPYSPGITVERPEPVGDYRVPDGRHLAGLTGRLVELLAEPVPTTCLVDVPGAARERRRRRRARRPARPASPPTSTRSPRRWARTSRTSSRTACARAGSAPRRTCSPRSSRTTRSWRSPTTRATRSSWPPRRSTGTAAPGSPTGVPRAG